MIAMRALGPRDEAALRRFWAGAPHAHLFAIPDLDHFGWQHANLTFWGWWDGARLVGYLMRYGASAQWSFDDVRVVPDMAQLVAGQRIEFVTGMEATAWPVLRLLRGGKVARFEASTVARLPQGALRGGTLAARAGRARRATLDDLDALTAVHVAAPDQFNQFDFPTRRRVLQSSLRDGWRRIFLAETAQGQVVAAAQTTAEGREMAVIGGVVTHPAFRGQGFGTLVTAHLCHDILARGRVPYLFYRRDNAPAARIYQKIGFVPLGDALLAELEWSS